MSKLQELIQRLCPDGVEYKKLGEVGTFENIGVDKKINPVEKEVVLLNYVDVYKHQYIDRTIPKMVVTASEKKIQNCTVEQWDLFITPTSETRDDIGHASVITETLDKTVYSYHIMRFRLNNPNRVTACYIRYLFETSIVQKQIYRFASGQTRFGLSKYKFAEILIPVPPLEVQEEIVMILDSFSDYAAELQAELQARKEQYEYYRNLLLTFNPAGCAGEADDEQEGSVTTRGGHSYPIQWKTMGEIFEMRNGYTPSKSNNSFWDNGTIPWFRMEDIRENGRILSDAIQHITPEAVKGKGLFEANTFILATTATIGEHALIIADSLANQQFTNLKVRKSLSNSFLTKYLYYYMFIVDEFCKNNTNISGFASVDMGKLKRMPIPVPPLELQEKIVAILDRFETLVNDLSEGLPAEIAAVKEQYEYYRNRLLTFKEKTA